MTWPNDDAFDIGDLEYEFVTPDDIPVYDYGELPDTPANTAPVVTLVSPPPGSPLAPNDSVVFDVTDANGALFSLVAFRVRFLATDVREVVYDKDDPAGAWSTNYAGSSITTITNGFRLTLRRRGGWPGGGIGLLPRVIDQSGSVAS